MEITSLYKSAAACLSGVYAIFRGTSEAISSDNQNNMKNNSLDSKIMYEDLKHENLKRNKINPINSYRPCSYILGI
ncbi:hypothetical protein HYS72_03430 [Candidatus Pacearchaeota archaeon]|nr:hypothetical protein [Candidatus Pacearchaeota archaeon]MBI2056931.1 hypothetical protein [Candidatus Pacearchaeota archaeon]